MDSSRTIGRANLGWALAHQGDTAAARAAADAAVEAAAELGGVLAGLALLRRWLPRPWPPAISIRLCTRREAAGQHMGASPQTTAVGRLYKAQAALAGGDLVAARRLADDAASTTTGCAPVRRR